MTARKDPTRDLRTLRGPEHPLWRGRSSVTASGYLAWRMPDHPNANRRGFVMEHVLVAARALGQPLPRGAQVHHIDGDRQNNAPSNLVICQDQAYHSLLHQRARAIAACGHATWRSCPFCHEYDDPANMIRHSTTKLQYCHRTCRQADQARRDAVRAHARRSA